MIFLVVVAVFFGLVFGSFLNFVVHRVPLRQSIVWPSSQCPNPGDGRGAGALDRRGPDALVGLRRLDRGGRGGLFALVFAYPRGMGIGGMLGAFLGPYAALAVFIGALAGRARRGVLMATGKMGRRTALPFGVFLAFAGVLVLFVGEDIWGAYAGLIGGV